MIEASSYKCRRLVEWRRVTRVLIGDRSANLNHTATGGKFWSHRGRVLGGSSAIDGMVDNPRDYDGWTNDGLPEWSYEKCN